MAEERHGTVAVIFADHLAPPPEAGRLDLQQLRSIPKPRRGVGLACQHAAYAMDQAGTQFVRPATVTPDSLRQAGRRAEEIDQVILDLEVVLAKLRQANLLFDAEAFEQLRQVNDQVKAQAKYDPQLVTMFQPVLDYFAAPRRSTPKEPDESK
jgi:hypothetical protein